MMARFVEFQRRIAKTIWINPDCVVGVTEQGEGEVGIHGADGENPWIVPGTVAEVLDKLRGDPQPEAAKAGDDIAKQMRSTRWSYWKAFFGFGGCGDGEVC